MITRFAIVAVLLSLSSPAFAQIDGAFQLGLGTDVVSSSTFSFEGETPLVGGLTVESDGDIDDTQLGFGADSGVVLNLGYGMTEQFILGALLQVGSHSSETDANIGGGEVNDETDTTSIAVGPNFEFSILEDGDLRPFLLASVAYVSITQEQPDTTLDISGGQVLGGVGLHWFLAPGFSFDPMLHASYASVSGDLDPEMGNSTELDGSVVAFGISLGVSGWIK